MGRGGFEPPKQFAADLQSVPFGHSGICPFISFNRLYIYTTLRTKAQVFFYKSAHPRGAYFPDNVWKVKKTAKAVFLEKVFLMGYLIKLQNVLGRLRDYNSKPFQIRKYQGFTKLTKTFVCFCALSPIIKIHLINISCFIPLLLTKIRYRLAHRYLIFILLLFYLFRHK